MEDYGTARAVYRPPARSNEGTFTTETKRGVAATKAAVGGGSQIAPGFSRVEMAELSQPA
jgi:hypothetical protein